VPLVPMEILGCLPDLCLFLGSLISRAALYDLYCSIMHYYRPYYCLQPKKMKERIGL